MVNVDNIFRFVTQIHRCHGEWEF